MNLLVVHARLRSEVREVRELRADPELLLELAAGAALVDEIEIVVRATKVVRLFDVTAARDVPVERVGELVAMTELDHEAPHRVDDENVNAAVHEAIAVHFGALGPAHEMVGVVDDGDAGECFHLAQISAF